MSDFFKFERVKEDIPFYNGTPEMSADRWIVLFVGVLIFYLINRHALNVNLYVGFAGGLVVIFLASLYSFRGHYSLLFKKITRADIKPMVILTVVGFIYSFIGIAICGALGIIPLKSMLDIAIQTYLAQLAILVVQVLGEELFKIIILIISMMILYKFYDNRKVSIVISMIITALAFAACHEGEIGPLAQVIIVQGVTCIIDLILYLNTKNVFVTFLSHFIFDAAASALSVFGTLATV